MSLTALFTTIITLALLLLTGFTAGKTKIVDEVTTAKLASVTVKIGQPFLIINGMIGQKCTAENIKTGLFILLISVGMHAVMAVIAYFCAKGIRDLDERKLSEFGMIFANCGFIGFPILEALLGDLGLFYGAFYIFGFQVISWTWGIIILARKRPDIKLTPKKIIINFGTVPSVIGFLLFLSGVFYPENVSMFPESIRFLPESFRSLSGYLGSLCTPLSMLITGANLARRDLRKMFTSKPVYLVNFVKLIVMPLVITTLMWLLGFNDTMVLFGAVMAALPCAAVVTMFGEMYSISPGYAAELVGSTSILCIATLFPMIWYAQFLLTL